MWLLMGLQYYILTKTPKGISVVQIHQPLYFYTVYSVIPQDMLHTGTLCCSSLEMCSNYVSFMRGAFV